MLNKEALPQEENAKKKNKSEKSEKHGKAEKHSTAPQELINWGNEFVREVSQQRGRESNELRLVSFAFGQGEAQLCDAEDPLRFVTYWQALVFAACSKASNKGIPLLEVFFAFSSKEWKKSLILQILLDDK